MIVDDTYKFHDANMNSDNYSHYSFFAKRVPLEVTNTVQSSGAQIYFNPLIPLRKFEKGVDNNDQRRLKYGVIQEDHAISELINWDSFALAGRT